MVNLVSGDRVWIKNTGTGPYIVANADGCRFKGPDRDKMRPDLLHLIAESEVLETKAEDWAFFSPKGLVVPAGMLTTEDPSNPKMTWRDWWYTNQRGIASLAIAFGATMLGLATVYVATLEFLK